MSSQRLRNNGVRRLKFEALCRRELLAGDMTNPGNALDVNNDSNVTAGDALAVINYMARQNNAAEGEAVSASRAMYPDTNGDSKVSASDALRVINNLEGEETATTLEVGPSDGNGQIFGLIVDPGNNPRIKFSAVNTLVTVTSINSQLLEVTFDTGNTVDTQRLAIKHDMRIQVIGENNLVVVDGAIIPDDLRVEIVWGTNNVVQVTDTFVGDDFVYRGNEGSDNVILDSLTFIGDDVHIKTKKGNDTVAVRNVQVRDDFFFHGGDGNDLLAVDGIFVGDDAIVRMNDHNDTASFANAQVGDVADIRGNRGFDVLAVDVATVSARRLRIDGFEAQGNLIDVDQLINDIL